VSSNVARVPAAPRADRDHPRSVRRESYCCWFDSGRAPGRRRWLTSGTADQRSVIPLISCVAMASNGAYAPNLLAPLNIPAKPGIAARPEFDHLSPSLVAIPAQSFRVRAPTSWLPLTPYFSSVALRNTARSLLETGGSPRRVATVGRSSVFLIVNQFPSGRFTSAYRSVARKVSLSALVALAREAVARQVAVEASSYAPS